jgi:hypothetical protein
LTLEKALNYEGNDHFVENHKVDPKFPGEVTKAENIKADLQRRIKPTAGGAEKKIKKD